MISSLFYKIKNNKHYVNSFWSLMGSLLPKFAIFLTSIFLARILNAEKFGDLSVVRSTINMFTVFASSGLGLTATKFISEYYNENSQEKSKASEIISLSNFISFTLGIIISLLVLLFSKSISDKIIGKPYLQIEIIIGAFMLLFNAINASQIGILSGFQKYKVIAVNSLVAVLLSFPIQIFGAYYFQIEGALLGFTVNFILLYLFNFFSIKKLKKQYGIQTKWRDYNKVMHVFYKFTIPSSLSSLMVTPITWFITVLLIRSQNGSYNLGVFEAANQIKMVIIFIPIALSNALLPLLMENKGKSNKKDIINNNIRLNFIISGTICLIVCLCSTLIMSMFGREFKSESSVLIFLSISTIFMAVNNVIGQVIASKDKMWVGFIFNLAWGGSLIVLSYIFIYIYNLGALSLALAYLLSYLFHTLWQFVYLKVFSLIK